MPVDLDELFDAVRRQADTIPLAGAGPARLRGRHRDRMRAVVTAAVVVTLVAVGTGLAMYPGSPVRHDYPAAPMIGRPIPVDGTPTDVQFATDGTRAYTAWVRAEDRTVWTATIDLKTGAVLQAPRKIADSADLEKVVIASSVAVVVTRPHGYPSYGFRLYFLLRTTGEPAGGRPIAQAAGGEYTDEDWVLAAGRIVSKDAPNRVAVQSIDGTESRDMPDEGAYETVRILGWGTAADQNRGTLSGSSAAFADPRVMLLPAMGAARVIDTSTGRTLWRVNNLGVLNSSQIAIFDGTLVSDDPLAPHEMEFGDVSGGNTGTWKTDPLPGTVTTMGDCGSGRICVVTSGDGPRDKVTVYDPQHRRIAWRATTDFTGPAQLSTVNGRTLVTGAGGFDLYDSAGHLITGARSRLTDAWLTSGQLLVLRADGTLTRRSLPAGRPVISRVSAGARGCTATTIRLVCLTGTGLATWKVG
jgi:hypothetical protein